MARKSTFRPQGDIFAQSTEKRRYRAIIAICGGAEISRRGTPPNRESPPYTKFNAPRRRDRNGEE